MDKIKDGIEPSTSYEATEENVMEVIQTKRGGKKILLDGHAYVKKKNMKFGIEKFECTERQNLYCYAAIAVKDKKVVQILKCHNHAPNINKIEALKIQNKIKEKASSTVETPHQIIQSVSNELNILVAGNLPSIEDAKRRIRSDRQSFGSGSSTELELVLTAKRHLPDGTDFLIYDSFQHAGKEDSNKILIFGTMKSIEALKSSEHWFCDGTFEIAPSAFYQLYTIHCMHNARVFPCIYALFSNKRQSTYEEFFALINEFCQTTPITMTFDFELAAMNAAKVIYPETMMHGCFFHFSQSLYRKIQALGMQKRYATDTKFSQEMKMFAALAFVPPEDVPQVFDNLKLSMTLDDKVGDFVRYLQTTYVGTRTRKPTFEREFWNVQYAISNGIPKTNNYVEGFNHRLKHAIRCSHPTVGVLIDALKKEYQITDFLIVHSDMQVGKMKGQKKVAKQERIYNMIRSYPHHPPLYYLGLVASNIDY